MIWTDENMKAVKIIKGYLWGNIFRSEEKADLIANEIVKELDRNGLYFEEVV